MTASPTPLQFEASQEFTLHYAGTPAEAAMWARQPERALGQVSFLRGVQRQASEAKEDVLSGELIVAAALLGNVALPFASRLSVTQWGATLTPLPLPEAEASGRGWVEVTGEAAASPAPLDSEALPAGAAPIDTGAAAGLTPVRLSFGFCAYVRVPEAGNVGAAAFSKMVCAAAAHTLQRVSASLPRELQAGMDAQARPKG